MTDSKNPVIIWVRFKTGGYCKFEVEFVYKEGAKDKKRFFEVIGVLEVYKKKGRKFVMDNSTIDVTRSYTVGNRYRIQKSIDPKIVEKTGIDTGGKKVYIFTYTEHPGKTDKTDFALPSHKAQPSQ
jgi:hypothetical protein